MNFLRKIWIIYDPFKEADVSTRWLTETSLFGNSSFKTNYFFWFFGQD